jgi:hypothetical protein
MSQWKNDDSAANSVWWGVSNHKTKANTSNQADFFGNVSVGSFDKAADKAVGQFGVDAVEAGITPVAHAGWVTRTEGVGGLLTISVTGGGSNYANGDAVEVVADSGANASGNVVTTTNTIVSVTISDAGGLFKASPTINITTGAGTGAMTGDASDDTEFPDV